MLHFGGSYDDASERGLGGRFGFTFLLVGGSRNELDDQPAFTKVIKNRALARDVLKILMIFEDFLTL